MTASTIGNPATEPSMGARTGVASAALPSTSARTDAPQTTADAAVNTTHTLQRRPFPSRSAARSGPNEPRTTCLAIAGRNAPHMPEHPIRDVRSGQGAVL